MLLIKITGLKYFAESTYTIVVDIILQENILKKKCPIGAFIRAVREGFEPPVKLPLLRISSATHSTSLASHRGEDTLCQEIDKTQQHTFILLGFKTDWFIVEKETSSLYYISSWSLKYI